MQFEHLVEINDLANPIVSVISREQLWRGLILRATSPKMFMAYIDQWTITDRTDISMTREIHYGSLIVRDYVMLQHLEHVHFDVPQQGEIPASSLRMSIEEPEPNRLFVRFRYDDGRSESGDQETEMVDQYRRSAYQDADIGTVRMIRELAESDLLNAPIN